MENYELLQLLKAYNPICDLEKGYKKQIIEFIEANPIIFGKKNPNGHITGSAWVVNRQKNKVLLAHHKKLDKWLQVGGHSEENEDILDTALREAYEESGLTSLRTLSKCIFDIDIHLIPQYGADKPHYHYDIRFLLEADDNEKIDISNESKDVKWVPIDRVDNFNNSDSIKRMVDKTKELVKRY